MAGDWIPIRINLRTDPRVVTMAALLKRSPQHIMGCLCQVWSAANEHTIDGKLKGYTLGAIDALTETKAFGGAMAAQGWLIVEADGLLCPDFDKYNSDSAKTRLQNARRAARHRNATSVTKVTPASRSQRDESNDGTVIKSVPTEQNRTEEKKKTKTQEGGAGSSAAKGITLAEAKAHPTPMGWSPETRTAWEAWIESRYSLGKPPTKRALDMALAKLAEWPPGKALEALRDATVGGWQGIYEPKEHGKGHDVRGNRKHEAVSEGDENIVMPIYRQDAKGGVPAASSGVRGQA